MGFFSRNWHILLFAAVWIGAALFVAGNPERFRELVKPAVEDAIELRDMARASYRIVASLELRASAAEAVDAYAAAVLMPSTLLARISSRLDAVQNRMRLVNGPRPSGPNGPAQAGASLWQVGDALGRL